MTNNETLPTTDSVIEKCEVKEDDNGAFDVDESSSDSLIEIKLNEFASRSELTNLDIRALVIRCSSCGRQINHHSQKDLKKHRRLGVITCKECYDFYGSSEFSQDESGYNYCTWCGNGGKLIVCDYCPNGFCSACIRRNFGRAEISVTTKEGWKCYCCNRSRLKPKVKFCNLIMHYDKEKKREKKAVPTKTKNALTEKWLQNAFDNSEEACKTFHRKISKLKAIGVNKSKSLKHVEKKMEQVINSHRDDLKKIVNCLSQQYLAYIDLKNKMEAERLANIGNSNGDVMEILMDDNKKNHSDNMDKVEPEHISANDDCIIIDDICDENFASQTEQSPSMLENHEDSSKHDDEKIKAKMSLLASSSDSEGIDRESLLQVQDETLVKNGDYDAKTSVKNGDSDVKTSVKNGDSDVKTSVKNGDSDVKMSVKNGDSDVEMSVKNGDSDVKMSVKNGNGDSGDKTSVKNGDSDVKTSIKNGDSGVKGSPKNESSSTVRRKLDFSDSGSDFDVNSKKKNKPRLSETYANLDLSDDDAAVEEEQEEYDPKNDPKLKLQSEVNLICCDHLLKNGEMVVNISETCKNICVDDNGDEAGKLDKLIDSLCRFPIRKKTKAHKKPKFSTVPKKKVPSKKVESESSSSISLSSDDEIKIVPSEKATQKIAKAKEDLMNSDSSSNLASEDEEEYKKSKMSKSKKKYSDSDDFQPRKKRKYDKLLHGSLLSDDDKKPKEKKERKLKSKKKRILSSDEENLKKESNKSSSTTTSDSDEDLKSKKQSRKRKRIKKVESSSNDDDDDDAKGDTPFGKGRKNIKKIISQKNLADETKEAQLEEKERKKRIDERQILYNKIEDTSVDGKEIITRKMVLEVDKESKEEIVEIHPDLVCKLKPHQVNGVKFMWECTIEAVKYLEKPGSGCILAHCMGLGKTLQIIAFVHTCLTNSYVKKHISRVMVVCPYNVALNWAAEFDYWLDDVEGSVTVHQLAPAKSNIERLDIIRYWFEDGGVLIISYDIFRRLSAEKIQKMKSKEKKELHSFLLDPGPDIVVCDEGHVLKNETSAISKGTAKLRTRRRIVLTGTPLQNNLKEYHCMLSFVKPNLLGTSKEFRNRFVNPIINGQYDDSTDYDVKLMKKRIHILHKLLEGCVHRCDYSALTKFLPPKHEFVISVKLSEIQMKMYECYLDNLTVAKQGIKCSGSTLFVDFNNLRCIWNHPYMCHVSHEKNEYRKLFRDDEEEFIDDGSVTSSSSSHHSTSDDDKLIENIREANKKKDYRTRSKQVEDDDEIQDITDEIRNKRWYDEFISEEDQYNAQLSGKMVLLMEILKECEGIRDKVILFSQSLLALDAIEDILNYSSSNLIETDKMQDAIGTWYKGLDYFRMDGTTSADFRKSYIDMFNNPNNDRARLFLISTKAGSLGTNLVGANRVIIFDTSWNPSHDVQAIFRAYRFGQVKPVYVYRLLAQGTMEEKIYDRQVTKLSLSCRVVDEQQIDRHFSAADLAELYTFDRNSTSNRPTPLVPKDRLLAELLIRNKEWIVTYHEHDSLLQNQKEEDLTEEERQVAWTEYENEREGKTEPSSSGLNEDELNTFAREPDFTNADYEGKMIPDLKTIIDNLYERLRSQMPGHVNSLQFRKQLLGAVYRVRQAFQEKHVKTLRMKQEFIAHGTVPNAINKYIDELSQALKSTTEYILKLQSAIVQEEAKSAQMQDYLKRVSQQGPIFQHVRLVQNANANRKPGPTIVIRGRMPQPNMAQHPFINQRFNFRVARPPAGIRIFPSNIQPFNKNQIVTAQPTITEVDDNASVSVNDSSIQNTNNTKSTVVIEEIS